MLFCQNLLIFVFYYLELFMIKIKDLIVLKDILNIVAIAQKSGMNSNTLRGKIIRGTELTVTESENISSVLKKYNLTYRALIEDNTEDII